MAAATATAFLTGRTDGRTLLSVQLQFNLSSVPGETPERESVCVCVQVKIAMMPVHAGWTLGPFPITSSKVQIQRARVGNVAELLSKNRSFCKQFAHNCRHNNDRIRFRISDLISDSEF